MNNQEAFNTLNDIRKMMEKSSRFLSLNRLSAIVIGIYACIGGIAAYYILGGNSTGSGVMSGLEINTGERLQLILVFAILLVTISITTVIWMCRRKARKNNQPLKLNHTARRLLWNFFLPLAVGGILCISLVWQQHYGLTSSVMLIFYGIALINASNYTFSNVRYLGYGELILGLADSFIEGHALLFWVIGFGFFHIIYGLVFNRLKG